MNFGIPRPLMASLLALVLAMGDGMAVSAQSDGKVVTKQ
jgi:hypothetical protein